MPGGRRAGGSGREAPEPPHPQRQPADRPPGLAFPFHLEEGGRKSHLDTNRGKQKPSHPPAPPCPPGSSPGAHGGRTLGACSGSPDLESLLSGNPDPSWGGWRRDANPPHSTPPRAAPTPTLSLPGGGVVGHFHSQEHLTVWAPEAGGLQWVLPWPRPHPRPTEPCRMERKVAGSLEDQPPCITHLLHVPDPPAQTEEPDDVEQIPDMAWRLHL